MGCRADAMTARTWIYPIGVILLLVLLVGNVIVTHNVFTKPFPGHNDFLSRWEGARSFWMDGISPYSEQASLNIQQRIYGRPVVENEDPGFFVYPFYTVFAIFPTVYMDYAWASAVWMVLLEVCLVSAMLLLLDLYDWQPSPVFFGLLLLWSLGDYFAARGLFLGQPSHLVYVLQIGALWALHRRTDEIAGAVLAISTLKPQMGYLMVPFLLLWALRVRRLRFLVAFGSTFAALMLLSFALEPAWLGDWIEQVRLYPEYTAAAYPDTGSPVWIMTQHYLNLGAIGEWALNLVFILPMLWAWYTVLVEGRRERFLWTVAVTLVVTHLVALRTATPHFVVFNLILVFYLNYIRHRYGGFAAAGFLLLLFAFSWAQFIITVQGRATLEHPSLFLPLPFALAILLWLTRRLWWEHAPPIHNSSAVQPAMEAA